MTIQQAIKRVREIAIETGVNMRLSWSSEWKEYKLRVVNRPSADYFTNDADDAVQTAIAMGRVHAYKGEW